MLIRLELHNHTTESDASITVRELIDFMIQDKVDAFAITDHNTISGHRKIKDILDKEELPIQCIYGMEYTTYYGHILCFNLEQYVPWENINKYKPELLFEDARRAGALVGVAHPFSFGEPFARGCEWEMKIHDFSAVDFIEIFNNPEPLHEVNEKGLLWWQELVLNGHRLAMTTGMDLHGYMDMKGHYATYIDLPENETLAAALKSAIKNQKTFITRGPVFEAYISDKEDHQMGLWCKLHNIIKNGFEQKENWIVTVTTKEKEYVFPYSGEDIQLVSLMEIGSSFPIIVKLYEGDTEMEHLTAIAPVLYC